jgi:hypothetical protein
VIFVGLGNLPSNTTLVSILRQVRVGIRSGSHKIYPRKGRGVCTRVRYHMFGRRSRMSVCLLVFNSPPGRGCMCLLTSRRLGPLNTWFLGSYLCLGANGGLAPSWVGQGVQAILAVVRAFDCFLARPTGVWRFLACPLSSFNEIRWVMGFPYPTSSPQDFGWLKEVHKGIMKPKVLEFEHPSFG